MSRIKTIGLLTVFMALLVPVGSSRAQVVIGDWPALYDPFTLHHYYLTMTQNNWDIIRYDLTFDIEVPALFSAEAELPILVSVRRKSATPFPNETDPVKVSLKVDINEFTEQDEFNNDFCEETGGFASPTCMETWHGVKKLSLENGDDNNVITEGFAWYLHRLAAADPLIDYQVGLANWVNVDITLIDNPDDMNIVDTVAAGVYVNVEQTDKTFLVNRGLWLEEEVDGHSTWFYEYDERYTPEYEEEVEDENGDLIDSPAFQALNYKPYQDCKGKNSCIEQPGPAAFRADAMKWINVDGLLTFGAVAAVHGSPDDLFTKAKNFLHTDYTTNMSGDPVRKREYIEWDLDSAFVGRGVSVDANFYDQETRHNLGRFETHFIHDDTFKGQYTNRMQYLVDNVFIAEDLQNDLDAIEDSIGTALAADIYNHLPDSVGAHFAALKQYIADRLANIQGQLAP